MKPDPSWVFDVSTIVVDDDDVEGAVNPGILNPSPIADTVPAGTSLGSSVVDIGSAEIASVAMPKFVFERDVRNRGG